jgi:hypothetical protein
VQAVSEGVRSIWDEYRLLGELFRGPATVAWNAEHVISGRRARLTTVHAPPMTSGVTAEAISHAFRRAAEQGREFAHPDHLAIIGIAEQSGLPVAVTMLPEGAPLSERLSDRPVPLGEAMKRVSQIAHAVSALHGLAPSVPARSGQRHGYLTPENLWVRADGRVALLDCGIHAAAAHASFCSGFPITPSPYVPPGDDAYGEANQGADVYALLALLVRLVTGRAPLPGELPAAVAALPDLLPASLHGELMEAATTPRPDTAPNARALAVHLAFDVAWIRAQERSRREDDLVEGELSVAANAASVTRVADLEMPGSQGVDEGALRRWARAYPAAGVRGGAARATAAPGPWTALAGARQRAAEGVLRLFRSSPLPVVNPDEVVPQVASYTVRLGPFAAAGEAASARARLRGAWPTAAVIAGGTSYYVEVTTCANRRRAEELVERFRAAGDPADIQSSGD